MCFTAEHQVVFSAVWPKNMGVEQSVPSHSLVGYDIFSCIGADACYLAAVFGALDVYESLVF